MKVRKNQKYMSTAEWDNFVTAFRNLKQGLFKGVEKPSLDDFADEHAAAFKDKNHNWEVHSHGAERQHWGFKFLAWHRVFLNEFENRLRKEVSGVTIPYWNAYKDPFPAALKKISDNEGKRVPFSSSKPELPNFDENNFEDFQNHLETSYHNHVHSMLGGTMSGRHSPRDAAFWLHHAFVDKQWGHWFQKHNGTTPASMDELILGDEIVKGKRVRDVLHTTQLGYVYGGGIFNNIKRKGSSTFHSNLEKEMILSAKLGNDDFYAKMIVYNLTDVAALITMQQFPYATPGSKLPVWPTETMYCDLKAGKLDVAKDQGHIRIVKKSAGSTLTYTIEAVNGTKLAKFTAITDFIANNGKGATDGEMLYI